MPRNKDATPVRDADGQTGWLDGPFVANAPLDIRLGSGERLRLAAGLVEQRPSGRLRTRVSFADLVDEADEDHTPDGDAQRVVGTPTERLGVVGASQVFQEIRETLDVSRVVHETDRVRVSVVTGDTTETVSEPTWEDRVEVRREPVGEVVTEVEDVQTVDGITIVPVYEEVLVVERRLVLRERLHIGVTRETTETTQEVTLRHQSVQVEHVEPGGRV